MASKPKNTSRRTSVQDIPSEAKELNSKERKKIKGGLLPYIEQDNLRKSTSSITDGTSNITDGTSNTIMKGK